MLKDQRDAKGAIEAFERALGAYQKLLGSNPDDVEARLFSVVPHVRLAGLINPTSPTGGVRGR